VAIGATVARYTTTTKVEETQAQKLQLKFSQEASKLTSKYYDFSKGASPFGMSGEIRMVINDLTEDRGILKTETLRCELLDLCRLSITDDGLSVNVIIGILEFAILGSLSLLKQQCDATELMARLAKQIMSDSPSRGIGLN
jgi:hypothetical protein